MVIVVSKEIVHSVTIFEIFCKKTYLIAANTATFSFVDYI